MPAAGDLNLDRSGFPTERYEPIRLLGKGALGEVYLAKDKTLGRTVAVKCLLTVTDEQVVAFHREAKIASKLSHAHVISSLDFGTTESGRPYLALEYFDGVSLEKLLEDRGQLTEELATRIFLIVAEALSYIHSHKIFHRDLKPSNILLKIDEDSDSIDMRIIDFGLSSIKEEFQTKTLMQGRTLVGTPLYMSPDQVNGGVYDARSEIYSLACLMFESLTGRPPFLGDVALEILEHHANTPPPLLADVRPDLNFSDGMQLVLTECLAKSKDDRFQTMDALVEALEQKDTLSDGDERSRNQKMKLRFRWTIAFAVTVSALLIGTGAVFYNFAVEEKTPAKEIRVEEHSALSLLKDPSPYLTQKSKDGDGFYIWGEENIYRLKRASEEKSHLDAITLRGVKVTSKELKYIVSLKPKLVYWKNCQFDSEDTLKQLSKLSSVEKMGFYTCDSIRPQSLLSLKTLDRLTTLILQDCDLRDEHLKALSKLRQVKQFVLDDNAAITLNGIRSMSRDDKPVAIWIDSGPLMHLPREQIERLKKEFKIWLVTNSTESLGDE